MRVPWPLLACLLFSLVAHAAPQRLDEDDPKLARVVIGRLRPPVPRFKLSYRYLPLPTPDGQRLTFHAFGFDVYPVSTYVRLGFGVDGGYGGGRLSMFYASIIGTLGVQYPWRVTPFVEGRFSLGLVGGRFQGAVATSVMLTGGVEAGLESFVYRRFYLSTTFGYAHPFYRAPDVLAYEADPTKAPPIKSFQADVFTFKLGLGF